MINGVPVATARRIHELVALRSGGWEISRLLTREGYATPEGHPRWSDVPDRSFPTIAAAFETYLTRDRALIGVRAEIARIEKSASRGGPQRYSDLREYYARLRLMEDLQTRDERIDVPEALA
ncbi:hypothetical protein LCGC14_3082960 [marine sediment metagenome]|uniref:Uncharacterized protein n=1 Tax=marine sediment metagenome TaxID=412755 RepID=A0A0F8WCN1_9ZZZZ